MSESELAAQLSNVLEKGFDKPFIEFCAGVFSSHTYSLEMLPAARMYGVYLRHALEGLTEPLSRKAFLEGKEGADELEKACLQISRECWKEALLSGSPFCELFVEKWCGRFADKTVSK